jgi:chromosome segregation ATPase
MVDDKAIIANEMKDLRTKSSTIESEAKFKKMVFGGISAKEVEDYIASVTQQFSRAEEAYRQRIDEFATHTEMLVKECEDALEQIKTKSDIINGLEAEQGSLKNEIVQLQKKADASRKSAMESDKDSGGRLETGKNDRELLQENELLKKELSCIQQERDQLGGEAAVLAERFRETREMLESSSEEKDKLCDELVAYRSLVRQTEMRKSFSLRQYSEKQIHTVNQTSKKMKQMLAAMDEMRDDLYTLLVSIEENKLAEKTKAPSETEEAIQ